MGAIYPPLFTLLTLRLRVDSGENVPQRNLRLTNIQAFEAFEGLVSGFSATINRFENNPDLMDEFVNIGSHFYVVDDCIC